MLFRSPELICLLRAASQDRRDLELTGFSERQIHWALRTGLGPFLYRATRLKFDTNELHPLANLLHGADLTARVMMGVALDATAEIIDACEGRVRLLTLLKGISLCESCYPEPHLRPMGDIDLLVGESDISTLESQLHKLGYRPKSDRPPDFFNNRHHLVPLFHAERGIWIEIHRGLFSPQRPASSEPVFCAPNFTSQLLDSKFQGRRVLRLSHELQVVYLASHWAMDWKVVGGAVPLLDLVYLLNQAGGDFDWELVQRWVHRTRLSSYLVLALSYLMHHRLVTLAPEILFKLVGVQPCWGRVNRRLMHCLIDQCLINGYGFESERAGWRIESTWQALLLPGAPFHNLLHAIRTIAPSAASMGLARKDQLASRRAATSL
jgi:hypothetical protein